MCHVHRVIVLPALLFAICLNESVADDAAAPVVIYDEAKQDDFGAAKPKDAPAVRITKRGTYLILGSGIDAIDDVDAFVFEVTGKEKFDFCLLADAAEFKKLYSVDADGKPTELAFGSTNPKFGRPRNISKLGLSPGKYMAEMYFGPQGAVGTWSVKIAVGQKSSKNFCVEPPEPSTAEKMKAVDWPGAISIYHGHNWGDDKPYVTAIKEAGFGAAGAAEWQIGDCKKEGLRAFVFIWPHEVAKIPAKHKKNKTVLAYYLSDRIQPSQWSSWASLEKMAVRADAAHPAFFTMRGLWGGIDQYCSVVRGRAMEYYHYHWDGNRGPHMHFALLDQYRKASLKNGRVPVCRIVEVRPEDMRKTRQTVWTCLAYGVRGYRWGGGIFDVKQRDKRGVPKRNAYGEEVKSLNAAIAACSPIFKEHSCEAVYHVAPIPAGYEPPKENWLQLEGKELMAGVFRSGQKKNEKSKEATYLVVANRDAFNAHSASVTLREKDARIQLFDLGAGKWKPVRTNKVDNRVSFNLELIEGGGAIVKVVPGG